MQIECPSNDIVHNCPKCGALPIPQDEWPQSGTHCFTVPYTCGTELMYAYGHEGADYEVSCDGEYKKFELPKITPDMVKAFQESRKRNNC